MSEQANPEQSVTAPPPALSVRPFVQRGGLEDLVLPRPFLYVDGDYTNAVINVGVNVGTAFSDAFLSFGLDMTIPPSLFWLLDPVLDLIGRRS